jgi:hypothetical protein
MTVPEPFGATPVTGRCVSAQSKPQYPCIHGSCSVRHLSGRVLSVTNEPCGSLTCVMFIHWKAPLASTFG